MEPRLPLTLDPLDVEAPLDPDEVEPPLPPEVPCALDPLPPLWPELPDALEAPVAPTPERLDPDPWLRPDAEALELPEPVPPVATVEPLKVVP